MFSFYRICLCCLAASRNQADCNAYALLIRELCEYNNSDVNRERALSVANALQQGMVTYATSIVNRWPEDERI